MNRIVQLLALIIALFSAFAQTAKKSSEKTDAEIKQAIIHESIAAYRGSCPCPYNVDRAGRRCGARSAYSRPGGASPICYEKDVTQKMMDDYRKRTER
jgi:hypothetical protein